MYRKASNLGVGVNYTSDSADGIVNNLNHLDFVEINTERFFTDNKNENISKIINSLPVVLHGLTLSVGADQVVDKSYLDKLQKVFSSVNCEWFSEHIGMTNINGLEMRSLMPVEFNEESVGRVVNKVNQITKVSNKPFLLENISYYYTMPGTTMSEVRFIREIVTRADCGLLLDLNNLYVNSVNHCYDPYDFLHNIPLERVVEVHLAGCDYMYDMLIDTHASHTRKEVLSLFEYVCKRTNINGVVIERDAKLDDFSKLMEEVSLVRDIYCRSING